MFFGKNLENLDSEVRGCDCICFGPLGPMLYQVDILWIFCWVLVYQSGVSCLLE